MSEITFPKPVIVRSRTGKYHRASGNGPQHCNTRYGGFRISLATEASVRAAMYPAYAEQNFCSKCFPEGAPSEELLARVFPKQEG